MGSFSELYYVILQICVKALELPEANEICEIMKKQHGGDQIKHVLILN